jgi:hypothetical protein
MHINPGSLTWRLSEQIIQRLKATIKSSQKKDPEPSICICNLGRWPIARLGLLSECVLAWFYRTPADNGDVYSGTAVLEWCKTADSE